MGQMVEKPQWLQNFTSIKHDVVFVVFYYLFEI